MNRTSTIPNPLRSGDYTLYDATYSGDVGSTDPNDQPVLTLAHRAVANVTVQGVGDPAPQAILAHYATFDAKGRDTLNLLIGGGRYSPFGPGFATVNLQPGARLTGTVLINPLGHLTVEGGRGSSLLNYSGDLSGGSAVIDAPVRGAGAITLSANINPASLELGDGVSPGETIDIKEGNVLLDQPSRFLGTINWHGEIEESLTLAGVRADSYSLGDGQLELFRGDHEILDLNFTQQGGLTPLAFQTSQGVVVSSYVPSPGATELPLHACGAGIPPS